MSPLHKLPLSTVSILNDLTIRVVQVDEEGASMTPTAMMSVDARWTLARLRTQIYLSITSDYMTKPHKIRLICTNTNGGSVFVSPSLIKTPAGYTSVSNHAKLKSFLFESALVRFQVVHLVMNCFCCRPLFIILLNLIH
jgi:hypothetical protein